MLRDIVWPEAPFDLAAHVVLAGYCGSKSHGTYIAPDDGGIDDIDILAVALPPARNMLGLHTWDGASRISPPWDVVVHGFHKFVRLLTKQNPNVLSLLWLRDDYLLVTDLGRLLLDRRDLFRHRGRAVASFVGYAHGQAKRMTQFNFEGYMGAKRRALVERFGFDTKNAAHLVRILRMGCGYVETGKLNVSRTGIDAEELKAIKRGEWLLDRVRKEADGLLARCRAAEAHSPLPEEIDEAQVDDLLLEAARCVMGLKGLSAT